MIDCSFGQVRPGVGPGARGAVYNEAPPGVQAGEGPSDPTF